VKWIVDGYNVIFSDRKLTKFFRNDTEVARLELLNEIQSYSGLMNNLVIIVFDGKYRTAADKVSDRLVVMFSEEGQTADELIKQEIASSTARRSLCIVSNDVAIIKYARICGVPSRNLLKSEEFLDTIRKATSKREGSRDTVYKRKKSRILKNDDSLAEKPLPNGKTDQELLRLFKEKEK